jgi:CBS-domain-containing membrane protein
MSNNYNSLEIGILPVATKLSFPEQSMKNISLEDGAMEVMTDLNYTCAISIAAGDGIDDAEYKMKTHKVKMLFVIDHNENVIGLLTYNDLSGQRILDSEKELAIPASEMCILDIMTGIDAIDIIDFEIIKTAKVGNIVQTLKQLNRQHILALENNQGIKRIRGIFSSTQIGSQLQMQLDIPTKITNHTAPDQELRTA